MLLLTGPPGSGKSHRLLEEVRAALHARQSDFRLLVPTATMAEHLRHELAREGLPVRPSCIQTLSRFVAEVVPDPPEAPRAALPRIVWECLTGLDLPQFRTVAAFEGFHRLAGRLVEELSMAAAEGFRLRSWMESLNSTSPYSRAFVELYEQVRREVARRGWALRAERLGLAARRLRGGEENLPARVYLDGFFTFARAELDLLEALRQKTDVTATLPDYPAAREAATYLRGLGLREEMAGYRPAEPLVLRLAAGSIEQECDEIARIVLEQHQNGRAFREIGIVTRTPAIYFPLLRTVLERFGIPARIYSGIPALEHSVVRFPLRLIDAVLSEWTFETALAALRLAPSGAGFHPAGDRLERELRERMPGKGLAQIRELANSLRLRRILAGWPELESWRDEMLKPAEWAGRARSLLTSLWLGSPEDELSSREIEIRRGQAAAVPVFEAVCDEAASLLEPKATISLAEYREALEEVLKETSIRVPDGRRDVVHVMDAYEARQWRLPVVVVCGLLEGQFPQRHNQDLVFPDSLRQVLNQHGLMLRTSADWEEEEGLLFRVAVSRATDTLVVSHPRFNDRGDPTLPSFLLQEFLEGRAVVDRQPGPAAVAARPRPAEGGKPAPLAYDLRPALDQRLQRVSVSAIEQFLQCPFLFFGERTLALKDFPSDPDERLDARVKGTIVHAVIRKWIETGRPIEEVFADEFRRVCEESRIPAGYRREEARLRLLGDLCRFAAQFPVEGRDLRLEAKFEFLFPAAGREFLITGRIDALASSPNGRVLVEEFKYSSKQNVDKRFKANDEAGTQVQAGLYVLAVREFFKLWPTGFRYWSVREADGERVWEGREEIGRLIVRAEESTRRALEQISAGRIEPYPADKDKCKHCAFLDTCRVEMTVAGAARRAAE